MRASPLPTLFGREVRRIHCLGVGGMGVSPLAIYLARSGWRVSGEDDALSPEVSALLAAASVEVGPLPAACDLVARSSAIPDSHPSFAGAAARGLPCVLRGELLAEVLRDRRLVAVCGSHGKTTTTAMLVTALRRAGFPAGFVAGGLFNDSTPPAGVGSNEWVVAEVDESDGTIARFAPEIAVIVNLDWDHPDRYGSPADIEAAFSALCARTRGAVLVSDACALSLKLVPNAATFGRSGSFSGIPTGEAGGRMTLSLGGRFRPAEVLVRALGDFNAANATAALAAAQLMGVEPARESLADYPGVRRRQAVLMQEAGVTVLEDYAHHPAEIRALLSSLRRRVAPPGRLIAVFQPHRHSRTAQFKAEFAASLALADSVHLLDVYSAGEQPASGGTTADVYAEIKRGAPQLAVSYLPGEGSRSLPALLREVRKGDLVVFVGAGDIDRSARAWVEAARGQISRAQRWDRFAEAVRPLLSRASVLSREEPLAEKTTLRVGGAARLYAEPSTEDDLRVLLAEARRGGIPVLLLGRGSNLIVPDEGVDALVVALSRESWSGFETLEDGRIRAGAGLRLKNLCGLAAAAGLSGFEFLEGIPGCVGGALRMNAGAMGGWIFDVVDEVRLMSADGVVATLPRSSLNVDYRHCAELQEAIALSAVLRPVSRSDAGAVGRRIDEYRRRRHESQPREPSAGCIFKNPPGASAGRLIEESGLKGARVGGAEVSRVHANFVVNRGGATSADVLELVRRVRAAVRKEKGVDLEPEALLYGKEWRDVL
ncbi:MAG: UDP-N-acetylmuramate dehydrogenase [Opitutaceae bacterium]|jgi:UDP-N-acetylmuramate--L-alanine ligase/UDP-N-acetylenolpyruvoylglucosamine reductase